MTLELSIEQAGRFQELRKNAEQLDDYTRIFKSKMKSEVAKRLVEGETDVRDIADCIGCSRNTVKVVRSILLKKGVIR